MYLSFPNRSVLKPYLSNAFHLALAAGAVELSQARQLPDTAANRNHFDV